MTQVKKISSRLLKMTAILMLSILVFSSCSKENEAPKNPPSSSSETIEGNYTGKYGFDNETPENDQKYKINSGGVFQEIGIQSGSVVGLGVWNLSGTTFIASYTMTFSPYSKYSVSGTFNPATGKLVGTWGVDDDPTSGGKIDMTRQ